MIYIDINKKGHVHILVHAVLHDVLGQQPISGLDTSMPLTFAFRGSLTLVLKY